MTEINVLSRSQVINVIPGTSLVAVTNAGPVGPGGPAGPTGPTGPPGAPAPMDIGVDWGINGWATLNEIVINTDGSQAFTKSVLNGRGRLTGTLPTNGNRRVAYAHPDTNWADSEITSLVVGPLGAAFNANAQQGHIHRVKEISAGVWEGIAAWTAVIGGGYETINTRGVRWDGAALQQSGGDSAFTADVLKIRRDLAIIQKTRFQFAGLYFNNLYCVPSHLYGMSAGDIVTIASSDSTFNATDQAVNGADPIPSLVQMTEPTTLSSSPLALDNGSIQFSGASLQKRHTPYWMSTRIRGGTTSAAVLECKRWKPEETEPDWGDPRVVRANIASNGAVPQLALGPGLCALWGAHFVSGGPVGTWGPVRFRKN